MPLVETSLLLALESCRSDHTALETPHNMASLLPQASTQEIRDKLNFGGIQGAVIPLNPKVRSPAKTRCVKCETASTVLFVL